MDNQKAIVLPNSKESEMMVLGCMLTSINALNIAADGLDDSDFYYSEHKIVFNVLKTAYKGDKPADVHLVCEELKRQEKLKAVGGAAYIVTLAQYAATSAYVEEYVEELKKLSYRRKFFHLGHEIQKKASNNQEDPSHILIETREQIRKLEKCSFSKHQDPIQFLHQLNSKFLFDEPLKKPMLLEFQSADNRTIGFLPKGIVAMLVGQGGIGKTHLLAQLTISIATGTPWLDNYNTTEHCGENKKGNVFLGMGENQYDDIHRVLHKASKILREKNPSFLDEASKRIAAFSFCGQQAAFIEDKKPSRYFYDFKNRLLNLEPVGGWSAIILDPVSRLLGADAEIDNAAATQFIALLEELIIDLPGNPTILFAHHVNKLSMNERGSQNQAAARGSSALTDGVRWQVNFAKKGEEEGKSILKMTKSNFTAIPAEIELVKDSDGYLRVIKNIPLQRNSK